MSFNKKSEVCDSISYVNILGDGYTSEVLQALCKPLNVEVAVKIISSEEKLADVEVPAINGYPNSM